MGDQEKTMADMLQAIEKITKEVEKQWGPRPNYLLMSPSQYDMLKEAIDPSPKYFYIKLHDDEK